jgi:5-methylcytosine-specific restriction enzyme subunit McrC
VNTAILFPMEVLFESFVAQKLRQQYPEWNIATQERKHYLITDLNQNHQRFCIKPDIVIKTRTETIVADTKWKIINQDEPEKNYQISQSDMYQLYAYGKKYVVSQLILIYPFSKTFTDELHFEYEKNIEDFPSMKLCCFPWKFENKNNLDNILGNKGSAFPA